MKELCVTACILENGYLAPKRHRQASLHLMIDAKIDFARKMCWALNGHKSDAPEGSTYVGVVSRKVVRTAFACAALITAGTLSCDENNACLQEPTFKKCHAVSWPE